MRVAAKLRVLIIAVIVGNIAFILTSLLPSRVLATPEGVCRTFNDVSTHYFACHALGVMTVPQPPSTQPAIQGYVDNPSSGSFPCYNAGVTSPCFLPFYGVTRGQFSKMISITYHWDNTPYSVQHFTDVAPASTFFQYIEAAYAHSLINGYPCGDYNYGTNPPTYEPCIAPDNRPYFRPGNGVTRGQMAKMNSQAAGFNDDTSTRVPTYADVPTSDAFFAYIERLTMHVSLGPYPPTLAPPTCISSTQPCFFQSTYATRVDAAYSIYIGKFFSGGVGSYAQVFPHKGPYTGVTAYVTTPDPGVSPGNWVAAPIGISSLYNVHYVESGPEKYCSTTTNCDIHPYATWDNDDGAGVRGGWDSTVNLVPNAGYTYRSDPTSGNAWYPQWCNTVGCYTLLVSTYTGNMGLSEFAYAAEGGESNTLYQHWGTIYIYDVAARRANGTWTSGSESCYNPTLIPYKHFYSTIAPCTTTGQWTVSY